MRCRIVEYATREQAQNAVNTLSNQNLMGRLVYVREVHTIPPRDTSENCAYHPGRIVRPSLVSSAVLPAAISEAAAASVVDSVDLLVVAAAAAAASSMCRTFVILAASPLLLKFEEPGHINGSMYSFLSMWDGKT
jgi:hypothetical protein